MHMYGKSEARTPEEYIAGVDDHRRDDIQRLHDLVREIAPELEPTMEFGILGYLRRSLSVRRLRVPNE